jgi:hypothetical protein
MLLSQWLWGVSIVSRTGAAVCTAVTAGMQQYMVVLAYPGSQCTQFMQLDGSADFLCHFILFYLKISQWIRQMNSIKFCANVGKTVTQTLAMIRQAFRMKAWAIHGKPKLTTTEKARQVTNKVKSMIIFHDIKEIVHSEFILAGQIVNSTYCCDILLELLENGCCITTTRQLTLPFSAGYF